MTIEEPANIKEALQEVASRLRNVSQEIAQVRSEMTHDTTIDLRKQPEISHAQVLEDQERLGPIMR